MIDKVYKNMYNKYTDFGQWTEEIIREGLQEAYELGRDNMRDSLNDCIYGDLRKLHEDNNL